ncbi:hypothetical protein NPIL_610341 [Nephila pilipes]|uniref:Uncharacterized protein n=1 Tax=Nephila pilipes TaxID=299642 RepID=A0A8X6NEP6_NEPPI|nr:hypothetical protein NPIL_610341 [Nephila pilipes]
MAPQAVSPDNVNTAVSPAFLADIETAKGFMSAESRPDNVNTAVSPAFLADIETAKGFMSAESRVIRPSQINYVLDHRERITPNASLLN